MWIAHAPTGLYPAILGKSPLPKLGKNDGLKIKIGKIFNDIEHNKLTMGVKFILKIKFRLFYAKHKCLSIVLIRVSHK